MPWEQANAWAMKAEMGVAVQGFWRATWQPMHADVVINRKNMKRAFQQAITHLIWMHGHKVALQKGRYKVGWRV